MSLRSLDVPTFVDYTFELGKYKNMNEEFDSNNFKYKLNALLNLMHMAPGTLQDNPFMGIDMSKIQFSENDEIDENITRLQNMIYKQSSIYIEEGFVENISIQTKDVPGELGTKEVQFGMTIKGEVGVFVTSIATPVGLRFKTLSIDGSMFL